jgi:putative membrane protein (TIGR04086 family)
LAYLLIDNKGAFFVENSNIKNFFMQTLKAVIISISILLVGILLFSIVVKFAFLNDGVIKAVNQFIKILAIFLGAFFSVKEGKGLLKGLTIGFTFSVISNLIFSIMGKEMFFSLSLLIDLGFNMLIGVISGIIAVNIRK